MNYCHVLLLSLLSFCWVFALPLCFVGCLFMVPFFLCFVPFSLALTLTLQWWYHDRIMVDTYLRRLLFSIPWHEWFYCEKATLPPTPSILAVYPHGLLCCGAIAALHQKHTVICVAPILFYVPIFGWLIRTLGCIPATYAMMKKACREGYHLIVLPGGVPEIVCMESPYLTLFFKKRYGFIKLAKETNVSIVPVFVEGETDTYTLIRAPFHDARIWLSWRFNIPIICPLVFGWYNTWLPKRVPLTIHVGDAISDRDNLKCAFKCHLVSLIKKSKHHKKTIFM